MTIHYLPTVLNTKLNDITTSLTEIVDKLDWMAKEMILGHGLSGSFEFVCSACAGTINIGNACIDISRKVEQHEVCENRHFVTVIDSDSLAVFCATCGNRYSNAKDWRMLLIDTLGLKKHTVNRNICDRCHCYLPDHSSRVSVELMISQVEYCAESNDGGGFIPIVAEEILTFCPACGNKMSTDLLINIVGKLVAD